MNKSILIIDDDQSLTDALKYFLESEGFKVSATTDWTEVKNLRFKTPELILLDYMLPGAEGFALVEKFQKSPLLAHIPVILMSAYLTSLKTEIPGVAAFLPKPFDLTDLITTINRYLFK